MDAIQHYLDLCREVPLVAKYGKGIPEDSFLFQLADLVLNHSQLVCFKNKFRITDAELYISQEGHFDPFTFGAEGKKAGDIQSKAGHWFLHGPGMEFTFGEPTRFRAILIRGIIPVEGKGEVSDGPWDTKEQLLRLCNNDLAKNLKMEWTDFPAEEIQFSERFNLTRKIDPRFASLPYRFYIKKYHA
ncbi:MAG: hypothetical protein K1X56_14090 [Flavobacteriales bacterium]|nr:hypothetical protein [Flavobacteriales bacterium]